MRHLVGQLELLAATLGLHVLELGVEALVLELVALEQLLLLVKTTLEQQHSIIGAVVRIFFVSIRWRSFDAATA